MYCENLLKERKIISPWTDGKDWRERKREIIEILLEEEYGKLDIGNYKAEYEVVEENKTFFASKAVLKKIIMTLTIDENVIKIPFYSTIPSKEGKYPFFVFINFSSLVPDVRFPAEEITDNGFAVLSFNYEDVTSDDNDFTNGLAGLVYKDGKRCESDAGKIYLWSFVASRILDYAYTVDSLDKRYATVIGHSRLGKTALLTGALDERFFCTVSNNSGCSGAALSRNKQGETVRDICQRFEYWFCENFKKYIDNEDKMPFDQHFLLSAIAPRYICVGSAEEDIWADPESEYLSCVGASEVYEKLGMKGFVHPDKIVEAKTVLDDGDICYHVRKGTHYLSREDWNVYMSFIKSKINEAGK